MDIWKRLNNYINENKNISNINCLRTSYNNEEELL